jgi:hypothetical protein
MSAPRAAGGRRADCVEAAISEFERLRARSHDALDRLRDLPPFGDGGRWEHAFEKAFAAAARLWRFQGEQRDLLTAAGLERWEIGDIAAKIGQVGSGRAGNAGQGGREERRAATRAAGQLAWVEGCRVIRRLGLAVAVSCPPGCAAPRLIPRPEPGPPPQLYYSYYLRTGEARALRAAYS